VISRNHKTLQHVKNCGDLTAAVLTSTHLHHKGMSHLEIHLVCRCFDCSEYFRSLPTGTFLRIVAHVSERRRCLKNLLPFKAVSGSENSQNSHKTQHGEYGGWYSFVFRSFLAKNIGTSSTSRQSQFHDARSKYHARIKAISDKQPRITLSIRAFPCIAASSLFGVVQETSREQCPMDQRNKSALSSIGLVTCVPFYVSLPLRDTRPFCTNNTIGVR
jgi:hypothetical protein